MVQVGGGASVGFAAASSRGDAPPPNAFVAVVDLSTVGKWDRVHSKNYDAWRCTTVINPVISRDGEQHGGHLKDYIPKTKRAWDNHLKDYIPKTVPYDLALRINKDGNVPQIQFNEDGEWHDFAPDKAALKAGPWFPFLQLNSAATRLSDHSVHRPKPTKSAGAGKL